MGDFLPGCLMNLFDTKRSLSGPTSYLAGGPGRCQGRLGGGAQHASVKEWEIDLFRDPGCLRFVTIPANCFVRISFVFDHSP